MTRLPKNIFTPAIALTLIAGSLLLTSLNVFAQSELATEQISTKSVPDNLGIFTRLVNAFDSTTINSLLEEIETNWSDEYIPSIIEINTYFGSSYKGKKLSKLLARKTGQKFGYRTNDWYQWLWNEPENVTPDYANFKAVLYKGIDPRFERYFYDRQPSARIRLDEIRWGGVLQDGIPPLRNPEMIPAKEASYLRGSHVVFGIEINGDARAYPKRILAWHEMFVDTVGGVDIAGVYCTLCGTVIPYKTEFNGVKHTLGTSGFLYRSNKLMYDAETQSLWNTIKGEPVLGPLVDKGIALEHLSVVTTTWREWKRRHPETTVLSLNTGHKRDYGEGVAYNDYFSTDRLMFNTPFQDDRLKNKQEVLALRFPASPKEQLAIDTKFLNKNPLYKDQIGQQKLLILTDKTGANRVYDPQQIDFISYDRDSTVIDSGGNQWELTESGLTSGHHETIERLPYHRAFWFGWHATFPETRLVK